MSQHIISFDVTGEEEDLIEKIADRALGVADEANVLYPRRDIVMDLTATVANGCPLRLADLLAADAFNFAHDIFGIRRHLDRSTGKLTGHFSPRFTDYRRKKKGAR